MNPNFAYFNDNEDEDENQYDKEIFESVLRLDRIESSISPIKVRRALIIILVCDFRERTRHL